VFCLGPAGFAPPVRYSLGDVLASSAVPGFRLPLVDAFDLPVA
jgi:hypothetical protein